jgi:Ca2+-binding RTX toxin-like protein
MLNNQFLQSVQNKLALFAPQSNFDAVMTTAFGNRLDRAKLQMLREQWLGGNFSVIPDIQILSQGELGTANGAYAASLDKIFVSSDFLARASDSQVTTLILEEVGHRIDQLLNGGIDSAGDEGDIFSRLVNGENLSAIFLEALRAEDDWGVATVGGVTVAIENENFFGSDAVNDSILGGDGNDLLLGGSLFGTNTGNDTLDGAGGNDVIYGVDGNDSLYGGDGNDTLHGGDGNDYLFCRQGIGGDQLLGEAGDDYLSGGAGDDNFNGGSGNDSLHGSGGNDYLIGGSGKDDLYGGIGNDTLEGESGNDRFYGGVGNDVVIGGIGDSYLFGDEGDDTLYSGTGSDTVHGGDGNDYLSNEDGNDWFYGDAGNDIFSGSANRDIVDGGIGDDQLFGRDGNDDFDGGDGGDYLDGEGDDDDLDGGDGDDSLNGGIGNDTLWGGNDYDKLEGEDGNDNLAGGSSSDTLIGGNGNDYLDGGSDSDLLIGGFGDDVLNGGDSDDTLIGGIGANIMIGGTGSDVYEVVTMDDLVVERSYEGRDKVNSFISYTLGNNFEDLILKEANLNGTGNSLDNQIIASGGGKNILMGKAGNDILEGRDGNDNYVIDADVDFGFDTINETATGGIDTLDFRSTSTKGVTVNLAVVTNQLVATGVNVIMPASTIEYIFGGAKDDNLTGNSLNNYFLGGVGNDRLTGGIGRDYLVGGAGSDILNGGVDIDTFNFNGSALTGVKTVAAVLGRDTIADFAVGTDKIALSKTTFTKITSAVGGAIAANFAIVAADNLVGKQSAAIVYSSGSGNLFYNSDGVTNGAANNGLGINGGNFALLTGKPALTASSFTITA